MHQLKEVDILSAKMDLLIKKLKDQATEKQEVMHVHDSHIRCEERGNTRHSGNNCPEIHEDVNFVNKIKDGTSNRGQTTKVIIKVTIKVTIIIISINHL